MTKSLRIDLGGVTLARVSLPRLTVRQPWGETALGPASLAGLSADAIAAELRASGELLSARGDALGVETIAINNPSVDIPGQLHLRISGELQGKRVGCNSITIGANSASVQSVGAEQVVAPEIGVTAGKQRIEGSARADGVRADLASNKGTTTLTAEISETLIAGVLWTFTSGGLAVDELRASGGYLNFAIDQDQLGAAKLGVAEARGARLVIGPLELTIEQLRAPAGLSYSEGVLSVPELEAVGVQLRLNLATLLSSPGSEKSFFPVNGAALSGLDQLTGGVTFDARVDATYPVIGRRSALHPIRLAVDGGVIDYKQLERSLARLENAALDFELIGDRLILEKDLPLVPFDNVTLVSWPLDAPALALAQTGRVQLRTLLGAEVAQDTTMVAQLHSLSSSLELLLGVADNAARFSIPNTSTSDSATLQLAQGTTLRVVGPLSYDTDRTKAVALETLTIEVEQLAGELRELLLGSSKLALAVDDAVPIRGTLTIENLAPRSIVLGCQNLRLTDLLLEIPADGKEPAQTDR